MYYYIIIQINYPLQHYNIISGVVKHHVYKALRVKQICSHVAHVKHLTILLPCQIACAITAIKGEAFIIIIIIWCHNAVHRKRDVIYYRL